MFESYSGSQRYLIIKIDNRKSFDDLDFTPGDLVRLTVGGNTMGVVIATNQENEVVTVFWNKNYPNKLKGFDNIKKIKKSFDNVTNSTKQLQKSIKKINDALSKLKIKNNELLCRDI